MVALPSFPSCPQASAILAKIDANISATSSTCYTQAVKFKSYIPVALTAESAESAPMEHTNYCILINVYCQNGVKTMRDRTIVATEVE